jgi:lysophospholipase L1-like esterase
VASRPGRTWIGRLLLAVVIPPLIVEALLQAGALVVAMRAPSVAAEASESRAPCAVLCVGDSFTYGLGATGPAAAYPAVLERSLRERPIDGRWRVANCGWPSRTSRDVLENFAQQLLEEKPRVVVALVGINDLWGRPKRFELVEPGPDAVKAAPSRFRLELRLPRLLALIARSPRFHDPTGGAGAVAAAATKPATGSPSEGLVGRWRDGKLAVEFLADGQARVDGAAMRWSAKNGQLLLTVSGSQPTRAAFALDGDRLRLSLPGSADEHVLRREGASSGASGVPEKPGALLRTRHRDAIRQKDYATAIELARQWIELAPDDPSAYAAHVEAASRLGLDADVERDLAWLRRRRDERPNPWASEALVNALKLANRTEEAESVANRDVERFPQSSKLWMTVAELALRRNDAAAAERAATRSIELGSSDEPSARAFMLRTRGHARALLGDEHGAMRDGLQSWLVDGDDAVFRQWAKRHQSPDASALLDAAGAQLQAPAESVEKAKRLLGEGGDATGSGALDILEDHLRQLVAFSRRHGVEVLVATYPFRDEGLRAVQTKVAAETGAALVDLAGHFAELRRTRERSELFVADGHCNDLGYEFVAADVEAELRRVLAPPPPSSAPPPAPPRRP